MALSPITTLIKKPTKKGRNYYFNIPIEFIRSGKINPEKQYEIKIFDISDEPNQNLILKKN
ncbi:hypothetical protein LCGC14_2187360 [marine sediment metagenome]|uniref:Uncharacterized protein n=1 Tax=marine sediment metagenome TaxID=412755 RepID=A0A0F9DKI1_9ZZZZ